RGSRHLDSNASAVEAPPGFERSLSLPRADSPASLEAPDRPPRRIEQLRFELGGPQPSQIRRSVPRTPQESAERPLPVDPLTEENTLARHRGPVDAADETDHLATCSHPATRELGGSALARFAPVSLRESLLQFAGDRHSADCDLLVGAGDVREEIDGSEIFYRPGPGKRSSLQMERIGRQRVAVPDGDPEPVVPRRLVARPAQLPSVETLLRHLIPG